MNFVQFMARWAASLCPERFLSNAWYKCVGLGILDGSCVRLVLIDTAGLHPFPAMRELRMRTGQVFLFVFSYDSPDSLDEAIRLFYELKRVKGETAHCTLYLNMIL